jgi:hypothetical protein
VIKLIMVRKFQAFLPKKRLDGSKQSSTLLEAEAFFLSRGIGQVKPGRFRAVER